MPATAKVVLFLRFHLYFLALGEHGQIKKFSGLLFFFFFLRLIVPLNFFVDSIVDALEERGHLAF